MSLVSLMTLVTLFDLPVVFPRNSDVNNGRFLACALRKFLSSFSHVDSAPKGMALQGYSHNKCMPGLLRETCNTGWAAAMQRGSAA
jgi:hypothetical protein